MMINRPTRTGFGLTWLISTALILALWFCLPVDAATSINSTSQNKTKKAIPVGQGPQVINGSKGYRVLASNDLGMHCSDLDYRVAAILPPYNTLHSQIIKIGSSLTDKPRVIDGSAADLYYSAAANPNDPMFANGSYKPPAGYRNPPAGSSTVFKGNFWECDPDVNCSNTSNKYGYRAYDKFYPTGILAAFPLTADVGLPTPDVERLYLGDRVLSADQSKMPGINKPLTQNKPQKFSRFNTRYPVFKDLPFGYVAQPRWFAAEGLPVTNWDDAGRLNAYPLMRVQAVPKGKPVTSTNLLASVDTVTPVSGEANCRSCHTDQNFSNGALRGNGTATDALTKVFNAADDPQYKKVPISVSVEWAADKNILALHDLKEKTRLSSQTPVTCQGCHYSPALDLAQVGPADSNGRQQTTHQSMSRVVHSYHAKFVPEMPLPNDPARTPEATQELLRQTCYTCHPGNHTKCLRGVMAKNNVVCQDCHGGMNQVGNDFTRDVSADNPAPKGLVLDGSLRVPWADEPGCGSCHTGDALDNLANNPHVIKSADTINLALAYLDNDANARPIVPINKRFAEPTVTTQLGDKPMLYRFSTDHGGILCQGCHGSTHAESGIVPANDNDDVMSTQTQGHTGPIVECTTCHKNDLGVTLGGPHGMHPVGNTRFVNGGHEAYAEKHLVECKACHGLDLKGTALSKAQTDRILKVEDKPVTLARGQQIACDACHAMPK
jgi:hypothetical protein